MNWILHQGNQIKENGIHGNGKKEDVHEQCPDQEMVRSRHPSVVTLLLLEF